MKRIETIRSWWKSKRLSRDEISLHMDIYKYKVGKDHGNSEKKAENSAVRLRNWEGRAMFTESLNLHSNLKGMPILAWR